MRKIVGLSFTAFIFLILPLSFAPTLARQSDDKSVGIEGTEVPATHEHEGYACHVYEKYVVFVTPYEDSVGEQIKIVKRQPQTDPAKLCASKTAAPHMLIKDDANFFFGLSGDYLFVDDGTGPEPRGLTVYDLAKKKRIYSGSYNTPIRLSKDLKLDFYKPTDETGECAEAKKWEAEGLGFGFERRVILDLATLGEQAVGKLRCSPRQ